MAQLGTITIQAPLEPLLNLADVCRVIDKSEKTVKGWVKSGYFPPPIRVGGGDSWTNYSVGVWLAWIQVCPQKEPESVDSADAVKAK